MTWRLEPNALAALRDTLVERGKALALDRLQQSRSVSATGDTSLYMNEALAQTSLEAETLLRRVAPFLELLYLMMVTDGKCDERERQLLRGVALTLGGAALQCAAVEHLLTAFDANVETEGSAGRLETVATILTADRRDAEAAFTLTATMATADGDVDAPEQAALEQLAEVLGLSSKRARELIAQCPNDTRSRPAP